MSLTDKVKTMLGFTSKTKADYIGPDVSRAVQRNEMASINARRALEEMKMIDTVKDISGKM